jgi:hypothetical protein
MLSFFHYTYTHQDDAMMSGHKKFKSVTAASNMLDGGGTAAPPMTCQKSACELNIF